MEKPCINKVILSYPVLTRPSDSLSNSATFIPYKLNQKDNLSAGFRKTFTSELLLVIIRSVIIHDSVKENIIPSVSEENWVSHFHRRTGRGGGGGGGGAGGLQPPSPSPQILGNSDILGSKRNLGKASFKRSFHVFIF